MQCIDKARDLLDAELTAMAGESYSRAYGVSLDSETHQVTRLLEDRPGEMIHSISQSPKA